MRRLRDLKQVDQNTGEILEGIIVYCGVKRNPYAKGWIMNSQEALEFLATDKDLKGETLRVLLLLCSRLDFENWIQITQKEIAEKLELDKTQVSRSIAKLLKKEILLRGPKLSQSFAYRLNPDYGWKGRTINLEEYRLQRDEQERKKQKERLLKSDEDE